MLRISAPLAAVVLCVPLLVSVPQAGVAGGAPEVTRETTDMTPRITLARGTTIVPVTVPKGLDLAAATLAGRRVAVVLRGIRADAPSSGGFVVRWAGRDEPIGSFNTFSLVGKTSGEDRTIVPPEPGDFLRMLSSGQDGFRIAIEAPDSFAEHITIDAAELIVE